ncbi:hypothetical protein PUNSTDRAFT_66122 [Punctularia strigosozonata HHB-11173 SS5]|uniref:uncharacterized protein n=1 Tax=Punctularia strigosozonata (strain HHB-11173) TaxID=741275 RepID=UPI00044182F8|nr:uncharacterized protein PUNSTDRAFT_66122 [Punctularia strigosozonata HHB-11173 SS5]EIN09645.1 hypothetical protein PUNSTDRAFT_66122 [Punctularia strigosozonata HHB-11173 SS5]
MAVVTDPKPTFAPVSFPPTIDPALSLELRLRWLEALLFGVHDRKGKAPELRRGETLLRKAEELQRRLDALVENNDGLKRFVTGYEQHAQYLTPSFALSGTVPGAAASAPAYEHMSPSELEAFLAEMEPDIRAADRDMAEIELLEKKGVTGAGNLAVYETLQPRLQALLRAQEDDRKLAASLEERIANLIDRHTIHVDALSELFVDWDDTLAEVEDKTSRLERQREEKQRLGYE